VNFWGIDSVNILSPYKWQKQPPLLQHTGACKRQGEPICAAAPVPQCSSTSCAVGCASRFLPARFARISTT
jgi:hypothetical protein